jgi:hypothetical protein
MHRRIPVSLVVNNEIMSQKDPMAIAFKLMTYLVGQARCPRFDRSLAHLFSSMMPKVSFESARLEMTILCPMIREFEI